MNIIVKVPDKSKGKVIIEFDHSDLCPLGINLNHGHYGNGVITKDDDIIEKIAVAIAHNKSAREIVMHEITLVPFVEKTLGRLQSLIKAHADVLAMEDSKAGAS